MIKINIRRYTVAMTALGMLFALSAYAAEVGIGDRFPSFFLRDINGGNFYSNEYFGEDLDGTPGAVILSFCASYCKPCKAEIPELGKLAERYRDEGLTVYLIAIEKEDLARELVEETGTSLPVLLDRYLVVQKLVGFTGIPFTVLVDRSGIVRFINTGFSENNASETMVRFEEAVRMVLGIDAADSGVAGAP